MKDPVLYAENVAKRMGTSVRQARRYLEQMEAQHGREMVGSKPARKGVRRFVTEEAFAVMMGYWQPPKDDRISNILADFGARIVAVEEKIDAFLAANGLIRAQATG
jgi:hypothetical protein